jgi:hypothetical protein
VPIWWSRREHSALIPLSPLCRRAKLLNLSVLHEDAMDILLPLHFWDRLCGLVVRVPGYRSRGPGSIPSATRFSEKQWVWNGVHSASWVQFRSYLKEKKQSKSRISIIRPQWSAALTTRHHLSAEVGTNSLTSGGRSVGIVCSRTKAPEFVCLLLSTFLTSKRDKIQPIRFQQHHEADLTRLNKDVKP